MKLFNIGRTYRSLKRITEILQVLTKHGFGHIVARLHLNAYLPGMKKYLGVAAGIPPHLAEDSVAYRFRSMLQELGPTFVKLGQILSSRPDILPENFIQELKLLQDHVVPFSVTQILAIIEKALGLPAQKVFSYFDEKVLASGSIGQVHSAQLPDGTWAIVKVKRPGIDKIIATDLTILRFLAQLAENYIEELRILQPLTIVEEFARTIQKELDFTVEAAYTEKFYLLLKDDAAVNSPRVFWEYTTPNIITLEKLSGTNIGDMKWLSENRIDRKILAYNLAYSFTKQYFVWGMFHADPHPGNILVGKDGKIYLIDFGMVGHLSDELKSQLATTVLAGMSNNLEMLIEVYADIGAFPDQLNQRDLKTDILELLDKYLNTPFQHLDMAKVFEDIVRLARTHKAILPRDFVLLGKSLVMITGLAQSLDPDFNLARAITPHLKTILKEKFTPGRLFHVGSYQLWSLWSLLERLPSDIKQLMRLARKGNLRLTIRHESLERFLQDIDRTANRLSFSIILASLLISASVIILARVGPKFHDIPVLGIIGYGIAFVLGFWLVATTFRSGRL